MLSPDSSAIGDSNLSGAPTTRALPCPGSEGGAADAAYSLLTKRRETKRWHRSPGLASKRGGFDNNDDRGSGGGRGEPPSKCGGWGDTDFGGGGPPPIC